MNEFPKSLYRPKPEGGIEQRSFPSEAAIPKNEGWTGHKEALANAKPAPVAPTRDDRHAVAQAQLIEEQKREIAALRTELLTERGNATRAADRANNLTAFLRALAGDDKAPDGLKEAILELIEPTPTEPLKIKDAAAKREKKTAQA